ncbi:MAG: hypothetical protein IID34_05835 [Planctomycetes bacterium]|nr:hypothetical protein [Planctomycetota bacterium]
MSSRQVMILTFLAMGVAIGAAPSSAASDGSKAESLPAAVADRVRWIERARRENPEVFTKVAPCYELVLYDYGHITGKSAVSLAGVTLDVLHPDYRAAIQAHPEVYATMKAAFDQALERVDSIRKQCAGCPVPQSIWRDYDAKIRNIIEDSLLPPKALGLIAGAVKPAPLVRLDPATLPAWEAALLDPNVPWVVKGRVGRIVARFEDSGSTPVLGWFIRQATRAYRECKGDGPTGPGYLGPEDMKKRQSDPCQDPLVAGSIVASQFGHRPREDIALELAGVLQDVGEPESIRMWGEQLRKRPEWMRLLNELAKTPDTATRLQPLLAAVGLTQNRKNDKE